MSENEEFMQAIQEDVMASEENAREEADLQKIENGHGLDDDDDEEDDYADDDDDDLDKSGKAKAAVANSSLPKVKPLGSGDLDDEEEGMAGLRDIDELDGTGKKAPAGNADDDDDDYEDD